MAVRSTATICAIKKGLSKRSFCAVRECGSQIARLNPQLVLLSVAAGNPRNLPDAETLQALQGYTLLRTDQNGWIELSADGEQMWVEVERR